MQKIPIFYGFSHSLLCRWKFQQTLMMDANFRLKMKDRGATDVALGPGWAYCVESRKFKAHVEEVGGVLEVRRIYAAYYAYGTHCHGQLNTCNAELNAIANADKGRRGYIATGVGMVMCARHAFVRARAVGDLQKGEK